MHGSAYKAYREYVCRTVGGSLPRTGQVHLHSRGVATQREKIKERHSGQIEGERRDRMNERIRERARKEPERGVAARGGQGWGRRRI